MWLDRKGGRRAVKSLAQRKPLTQVVAMARKQLKGFSGKYVERCGEVVEVQTNKGELATFIAKDCCHYGLIRLCYLDSVEIHRYSEGSKAFDL